MIFISDLTSRARVASANPPIPGMTTSVSIRWTIPAYRSSSARASSPLLAVSTV